MNIKNLKPNGDAYSRQFKQGYFTPINKHKYKGRYPIIYRSSLELKFCMICDSNDNITMWSSESVEIPYWNPIEGMQRTYNPDYLIEILTGAGKIKYMVEVKPKDFTVKPKPLATNASLKARKAYNFKLRNFVINMHKKMAADRYCREFSMKYIFLTESFFAAFK